MGDDAVKEPCTAPPGRFCAEGSSVAEGNSDCSVGWYCVGYHFMPQPCSAAPGVHMLPLICVYMRAREREGGGTE